MNNTPNYSIIIPTFNSATTLTRSLDSINKQSYRDFEVIICDDGSNDHTEQIVNEYRHKFSTTYLKEKNWGGPARPRNNGLKVAKGCFIAFLDADDWWYPNKLEIVNKFIDKADIVYHDLDIYTSEGRKIFKKVKGRNLKKPVFNDLMLNENCLITSSVVARKSIVDMVEGFSEGFLTCVEDFDLWLKIARITEKFCYIPKNLGAYWINLESVSVASERICERLQFVYNKYLSFLDESYRTQSESVLHYLLGRTRQKMGQLDKSINHFKLSIRSNNLNIKIRSLCWLILIAMSYKKYSTQNE